MKRMFHPREFVTALPNPYYRETVDGWTARVKEVKHQGSGNIRVEGYDRYGGYATRMGYIVASEYFIPYSNNMETEVFGNFIKCGGD